ncbi:MAG: hypothetical protein DRP45_05195 [Candidatus Zixiibacteriota bacterium]|nr:MAG: hypothetical protein DRP45_05195 [candidate division Zixibacteria bacterium]
MYRFTRLPLSVSIGLFLLSNQVQATPEQRIPGETWLQYATPEDAGFSSEKLAEAKVYYDSTAAAAVIVIYQGAVLVDWGETARRFRCHSARKGLMSGMLGAFIDKGIIDSTTTLAEMGIDDTPVTLHHVTKQSQVSSRLWRERT